MSIRLATSADYFSVPAATAFSVPATGNGNIYSGSTTAGWYRAMIVRSIAANSSSILFSSGNASTISQNSITLSNSNGGKPGLDVYCGTGSLVPGRASDVTFPSDGAWRLIVMQCEYMPVYASAGLTTQNITKIYITNMNGGTRCVEGFLNWNTTSITSTYPMNFGYLPGASGVTGWVGDIYMAFGGKGNLTPAQMNQIMCGVDPISGLGLTLDFQYKPNSATNGATFTDLSGNGNTATLTSTGVSVVSDPLWATSSITVDQPLPVIQRKAIGPNLFPLSGTLTGSTITGVDAQIEYFGFTLRCNAYTYSQTGTNTVLLYQPTVTPTIGMAISGTSIPASTTITAWNATTNVATISANLTATLVNGATITIGGGTATAYVEYGVSGTNWIAVTTPSMQGYGFPQVGAPLTCLTGTFFPAGTTITQINYPTSGQVVIYLSNNLTANCYATAYLLGWGGVASSTYTTAVSNAGATTVNAQLGYQYYGTPVNLSTYYCPAGTYVVSGNSTTITLSNNLTNPIPAGTVITFGAGTPVTGGAWQTVASGISGTTWSGSHSGAATGCGYLVRIRPTNYASITGYVTATCWTMTGIGKVVVFCGQSLQYRMDVQVAPSPTPVTAPTLGYTPFQSVCLLFPGTTSGNYAPFIDIGGVSVSGAGGVARTANLGELYGSTMPVMQVLLGVGGTSLLLTSQQASFTTSGSNTINATGTSTITCTASTAALVLGFIMTPSQYISAGTYVTAISGNTITVFAGPTQTTQTIPAGTTIQCYGQCWNVNGAGQYSGTLQAWVTQVMSEVGGDFETVVWNQGEAEMATTSLITTSAAYQAGLNSLYSFFLSINGRNAQTCKMLTHITGSQYNQGTTYDSNSLGVRSGQIAFANQWTPARLCALQTDWSPNTGDVHPWDGGYEFQRCGARQAFSLAFHDGIAVPRGIGPTWISLTGAGSVWRLIARMEGGTALKLVDADQIPADIQISDSGFTSTVSITSAVVSGPMLTITLSRPVVATPNFRQSMLQAVTPYVTLGASPIGTTIGTTTLTLAATNTLNVGDHFCAYASTAVGGYNGNNGASGNPLNQTFTAQAGTTGSSITYTAYSPSNATSTATGGGTVFFRSANYVSDNSSGKSYGGNVMLYDGIGQGIQAMPANLLPDLPRRRRMRL